MTASSVRPLSNSQKLFLQRLLVAHVLTDTQARHLYSSIRDTFSTASDSLGNSFEHCLGLINRALKDGFQMELSTVLLPPPYDPEAPRSGNNKSQQLIKYHAIVNRSPSPNSHPLSPHESALLRLIVEKIIQSSLDLPGPGCPGVINKMDMINSRTELEGAHEGKLDVGGAERAIGVFVGEQWLVPMEPPEDDDDDDDDGENTTRKRRRSSPKGGRRQSLKGTFYGIGPRCFLEIGEFLQKAGWPVERMPQIIINLP